MPGVYGRWGYESGSAFSALPNRDERRTSMEVSSLTKQLLEAKRAKGLSFAELGKIIGRDQVWVAALLYGQARADDQEAKKLVSALGLGAEVEAAVTDFPNKGLGPVVPTDPLIYRFYEIMQVYGMPIKAIIHEQFGDGIMSAIDFSLHIDKEPDPKGDRVKVTMSGKFLPYKKF
jgi:cyanate lyase